MHRFLKPLIAIIIIVLLILLLWFFMFPQMGLFLYNEHSVISCFTRGREFFEDARDVVMVDKCSITKNSTASKAATQNGGIIPKEATFQIYTVDGSYVYTTGDDKLDNSISKVLSYLTFERIYYSQDCVIFKLSSPLVEKGQGILYATGGNVPQFLSGIITAREIGDGWFYFDEGAPGDYPG